MTLLEISSGALRLTTAAAVLHAGALLTAAGSALAAPALEVAAARRGDRFVLDWLRRHAAALAIWPRAAALASGLVLAAAVAITSPTIAAAVATTLRLALVTAVVAELVSLAAGLAWARGGARLGARGRAVAGWLGALAALKALGALTAGLAFLAAPEAGLEPAGTLAFLRAPLLPGAMAAACGAAIACAGLLLLATTRAEAPAFAARLARLAAVGSLAGLAGVLVGAGLLSAALEPAQADALAGDVPSATAGLAVAGAALAALVALLLLVAWGARRSAWPRSGAVTAAGVLLALAALAGGEAAVAGVRLPWAIGAGRMGALYANGLTPAEVERARAGEPPPAGGAGAAAPPGSAARGEDLFRRACAGCHAPAGGPVAPLIAGLPASAITPVLLRLPKLRGRMPPFPGTRDDAAALAAFLAARDGAGQARLPAQPPALVAAGRAVLEHRCLGCHRDVPLKPRVAGWSAGFAFEVLGRLPRMAPGMPPFPGDPAERRALAAYLAALGSGDAE